MSTFTVETVGTTVEIIAGGPIGARGPDGPPGPPGATRAMGHVTGDIALPINSVALVDVAGMSMAVIVNTVYRLFCDVFHNGNAAAGLKLGWTAPAGSLFTWHVGDGVKRTLASQPVIAENGTDQAVRISGLLTTGGAAGTLKLQAAQGVANAAATKVLLDSYAELWSP